MSRRYWRKGTYQITTHLAVVSLLVIMFVLVGYFLLIDYFDPPLQQDNVLADLENNRILWERQRPADYRYVVDRSCDCPDEDEQPYVVTVESGTRSARYPIPVESSAGVLLTEPPRPVWVSTVFERIEQAVGDGATVTVRFSASFGYPVAVEISRQGESADRYEIRDFEVLR